MLDTMITTNKELNNFELSRVKYMYLKYEPCTKKERVLTIARYYHKDLNEVSFAYAVCCTKDRHNRRIGRQIALNRLQRKDLVQRRGCENKRAIDVTIESIASEDLRRDGKVNWAAAVARKELELMQDDEQHLVDGSSTRNCGCCCDR